jgi:ankyrin repeat domain-containing protein 50
LYRFLLAKFQLDYILKPKEPRRRLKALETVPKDLPSAYHDVLDRIERSDDGDTELALEVLSWISRAQRTLRMDELLECLVVEDDDVDLERKFMLNPSEVVRSCQSLVIYNESSGLVQFVHYTVQEFVQSTIQSKLPPSIHLAMTCLTYLQSGTLHVRIY